MLSWFANLLFLTLAGFLLNFIIKRNRRDKYNPYRHEESEQEKELEREIAREKSRTTPPIGGGGGV